MHTKILLKQYGPLFHYSRVCDAQALNSLHPAAYVSETLQCGTRSQYKTLELLDLLLVFQFAKIFLLSFQTIFSKVFCQIFPFIFPVSCQFFSICHFTHFSFFPSQNISNYSKIRLSTSFSTEKTNLPQNILLN